MAIPAALGAALAKARTLAGIGRALGGGPSRRQNRRPCCLASCAGCVGCVAISACLVLAIGGALLAAAAHLAGVGIGGDLLCSQSQMTVCPSTTSATVGQPMSCQGLTVSQGFGNTPWEHPHTGLDLVCPAGTPVVAVANGIFHQRQGAQIACTFPTGRTGGLGTYGELDARAEQFFYGHLERFALPDGATVVVGERLGYEGATGCATGDHLHFELRIGGRAVDPCSILPTGYPYPHDSTGSRCWGSAQP